MRRAATQLDFALGQPLDVWVHVADAGWPELPLPINAAPRGVTLETVASSRARAGSLFPDYSLAGWEAIGYDHREHSLAPSSTRCCSRARARLRRRSGRRRSS